MLLLLSPVISFAATYYVSPAGSDTTGNGTRVNPWRTPYYGCTHMVGGDSLILMDGTYSYISGGARTWSNQIRPPSGPDANHYTIVKAENDWKAIIDFNGEGVDVTGGDAAIAIWGAGGTARYIQVEGIKIINTFSALTTSDCQYIKIKRIAHISSAGSGSDTSGYGEPFVIQRGSDHVLLEDSWTSGCIRYGVLVIGDNNDLYADTTNIIIRRVVVRMDYKTTGQPKACFAAYGGDDSQYSSVNNILFQNCIAIDWNPASPGMADVYGGFYAPKFTKSVAYQGCIALNLNAAGGCNGFYTLDNYRQNVGPNTLTDCIAWDVDGMGIYWDEGGDAGTRAVIATANHCTLGDLDSGSYFAWDRATDEGGWITSTIKNSIIDTAGLGSRGIDVQDYNSYNITSTPSGSTHTITSDNGLLYLPRIETNSFCYGTGEGGTNRGATILYRYGLDGTLWGETGYNTLTVDNLWPYPYEDNIRSDFRTTNNPTGLALPTTNNVTRGFCADGQTLTKYIWEYLGNTIPSEIYAGGVLNISTSSIANGTRNVVYAQTLAASGGTAPYIWSIASGSLPTGLSLNSSTGVISGTPTLEGAFSFGVLVTDSATAIDTQSLSITISAPDITAPVISSVTSSGVTNTAATVTWTTNEASSSQVEYGTSAAYGSQTTLDSNMDTSHSVNITGLNVSTTYHYRVLSSDAAVNQSVSGDYTFTTTVAPSTYTAIAVGDTWKYFKGITNPGTSWAGVSFNDALWLEGATGIGYGDSDDVTILLDMQNSYASVYARKTFNLNNASTVTGLVLTIDYDDGFVAYINGIEVIRSYISGIPAYNTLASTSNHEAGIPENFDLSSYLNLLRWQ
jgi:hypothetical protein